MVVVVVVVAAANAQFHRVTLRAVSYKLKLEDTMERFVAKADVLSPEHPTV